MPVEGLPWHPVMADRQPLLSPTTLLSFAFNEPLLCTNSIITAIWLSWLNMPPCWKVLLREAQLASDVQHILVGCVAFPRWHDNMSY